MHPPLNKIQYDVLRTVRYEPRDASWSHRTLCYLRALGLVTSAETETTTGRRSIALYRWTVTPLGIEVYSAGLGKPVPIHSSRRTIEERLASGEPL